jgi:hypothetical protein
LKFFCFASSLDHCHHCICGGSSSADLSLHQFSPPSTGHSIKEIESSSSSSSSSFPPDLISRDSIDSVSSLSSSSSSFSSLQTSSANHSKSDKFHPSHHLHQHREYHASPDIVEEVLAEDGEIEDYFAFDDSYEANFSSFENPQSFLKEAL